MKEIILIGNPNTGKTTLYNSLTKSSEHTGNWHGVTVDEKSKNYLYKNEEFLVSDLPGIYSLSPLSFEEEVSVNYLYSHPNSLVVNIVDINNLSRNLYLTLELIALGVPIILAVNKITKEGKTGGVKLKNLYEQLGIQVLEIDAESRNDVIKLKEKVFNYYFDNEIKNKEKLPVISKKTLKNSEKMCNLMQKMGEIINFEAQKINLNIDYVCLKCLENDEIILKKLKLSNEKINRIDEIKKQISIEEIASEKYKIIDEVLNKNKDKDNKVYGKSRWDKFVLNKYLSLPIFLSVLFIIFYFTFFSFGKFLSEILSRFINNQFANFVLGVVKSITKSEIIYDFFESGIVGGIGSVFSFLPQVVILFLCLGIMEDSGYLSRVAFSLDDIFSKVGLSGKSVYTLLMGFGCSTSACMTARVMEDRNSKIKTAMLAPYMSCSAKLPIYAVLGSAFFGASNVFVIFAMYMVGVLVALVLSVFYEKTFLKTSKQTFILEFPPYRKLKAKRLAELAITSGKQFLFRVGSVLISVNIIIWVLTSFSFGFSFVKISGEASMLEVLGGIIAPIFSPLGFGSWGATSALLAGLIAKEVIVSTIAMVNGVNSSSENYIQSVSKSLTMPNSAVCFNPASALSYMVFCLLYSPCIATISVLKKEVGKKWLIVSVFVQFIIAYLISLIVYSSVSLILSKGILMFLLIFMVFILVLFALFSLIKRFSKRNSCHLCGKCKRS